MTHTPTCWDCLNSEKDHNGDYSVGIDPSTMCLLDEVAAQEVIEWNNGLFVRQYNPVEEAAVKDANTCPFFNPIMLTECGICHESMNQPRHEAISEVYFEEVYVCSEACAKKVREHVSELEKAMDRELELGY